MAKLRSFASASFLVIGCLLIGRGTAKIYDDMNIDMETWLDVFGDGFTFDMPDMDDFYSEANATASIIFGHRKMPKLQANALGANENKDVVENCGPDESDLSVTWEPSGPLVIGNTYTLYLQATALDRMNGDGHLEPKLYRDGVRLIPRITSVPFCKFLSGKHHQMACVFEKGERVDYSYTGEIPRHTFLRPGHYHGSLRFFNGDHNLMLCVTFDVTLFG